MKRKNKLELYIVINGIIGDAYLTKSVAEGGTWNKKEKMYIIIEKIKIITKKKSLSLLSYFTEQTKNRIINGLIHTDIDSNVETISPKKYLKGSDDI